MARPRAMNLFLEVDIAGMRSSKTYYLPDHVGFYSTNSAESLAVDLSQNIFKILNAFCMRNVFRLITVNRIK